MDTMDAILNRRSVRKFTNKKLSKEIILEIIKAGMYAPSACNEQPWHFIIINERKILDKITTFHPYSKMLETAPVAILVLSDLKKEKAKNLSILDCSAATQNMLLAATNLGIGSVWVNCYFNEDFEKAFSSLLNLPSNIKPFSLIPLGYANEIIEMPDRLIKTRIHENIFKLS